ncbi:MAG: hypothetical protein WC901_06175 [Candidatus Margulisiibacteriota bacterium]
MSKLIPNELVTTCDQFKPLRWQMFFLGFTTYLLAAFLSGCVGGGDTKTDIDGQVGLPASATQPTAQAKDSEQANPSQPPEPGEDQSAETQFIPLSRIISREVFPEQLIIAFYAEPARVSSQSYAKLSGVIIGKYNLALFSLGNSSCTRKIGERIGNYVLVKIEKDSVLLSKCADD